MSKTSFNRNLTTVFAFHVVALGCFLLAPLFRGCRTETPPPAIPIEFVVEVPAAPDPAPVPDPAPAVEPDMPPPPADLAAPDPAPKPEPRKVPIKRSTKRVTRTPDQPPKPQLTQEEIQRMLDLGARPSDHTTTPSDDSRYLLRIQQAMNRAWAQPADLAADGLSAEVTFSLGTSGIVSRPRLTRSSGSAAMDASVLAAVRSVPSVPGLPPEFVTRHGEIAIEFRLESP